MMLKAVVLVLTVLVSGSSQQCFSSNDTASALDKYQFSDWTTTRLQFSLKLFQYMNKGGNLGNVILSPSSVFDVLMLAYFGAATETETSINKVLGFDSSWKKSEIWRSFRTQNLITSDQQLSTYPLKTANKLFFSNKLNIRRCVTKNLEKDIELIDYQTDVEKARTYINKWIEDVTQGEIKDFLKNLSPTSSVTLVNAVYFKAKWEIKFDPKYTKRLPFHVNSKINKMTNMMETKDDFYINHVDGIKAQVLKLFFQGDRQAMFFILPDDNLDTTIQAMTSHDIDDITEGWGKEKQYMKVMIPKFKKRNEIHLNGALEEFGIGNGFSDNADYSRFTGRKEVSFNTVKQEAMIEVDEEGAKAAAASGGIEFVSAINREPSFICDRPFAYFIYDYLTNSVIFMGTFRQPE